MTVKREASCFEQGAEGTSVPGGGPSRAARRHTLDGAPDTLPPPIASTTAQDATQAILNS